MRAKFSRKRFPQLQKICASMTLCRSKLIRRPLPALDKASLLAFEAIA
jgi:hypothetical protein